MISAWAETEPMPHEFMALRVIAADPGHCVGVIDGDDKLAAAIVFEGLKNRGWLVSNIRSDGPHYYITTAGRAALKEHANE